MLEQFFTRARPLEEGMAAHQAERDRRALPMYDFTCQFASFEPPPPERRQLLAAMQGDQEAMDGFVRMFAGVTSPAEFFSEANVKRILSSAR